MNLGLFGKNALITGGSHGIGRSIALSLADEGCNIAFCGRKQDHIDEVVNKVRSKDVNCRGYKMDITNPTFNLVENVLHAWERIDILINNVGGGGRWGQEDILETDMNVWEEVYDKNVITALKLTRDVLPSMKKKKWGRIVTVTSMYGLERGGRPWFNVAKAAQTVLMKNLSACQDFVRNGITFNSIAPGPIMISDTGWEKEISENPSIKYELIMGRLGTPEEVADLVCFICSEKSSYINGASILVDGGESKCF